MRRPLPPALSDLLIPDAMAERERQAFHPKSSSFFLPPLTYTRHSLQVFFPYSVVETIFPCHFFSFSSRAESSSKPPPFPSVRAGRLLLDVCQVKAPLLPSCAFARLLVDTMRPFFFARIRSLSEYLREWDVFFRFLPFHLYFPLAAYLLLFFLSSKLAAFFSQQTWSSPSSPLRLPAMPMRRLLHVKVGFDQPPPPPPFSNSRGLSHEFCVGHLRNDAHPFSNSFLLHSPDAQTASWVLIK